MHDLLSTFSSTKSKKSCDTESEAVIGQIGPTLRVLSDEAGRMGADGIEVTENDGAKFGIGGAKIAKNLLDVEFRLAIRICHA